MLTKILIFMLDGFPVRALNYMLLHFACPKRVFFTENVIADVNKLKVQNKCRKTSIAYQKEAMSFRAKLTPLHPDILLPPPGYGGYGYGGEGGGVQPLPFLFLT